MNIHRTEGAGAGQRGSGGFSRPHRTGWLLVGLLGVLLPGAASGQVADTLIIPLGQDEGFRPSVAVAQALAQRINGPNAEKKAVLYFPLPSLPPPDKKEVKQAEKLYAQVKRAFERMQYEQATSLGDKLLDVEKNLMKKGRGSEGYVRTLHILCAAAHLEGKVKRSFRMLADALLFDTQAPDKKLFGPDIERLHQRVVSERDPEGTLKVSSQPPSLLWLNGQLQGLAEGEVKRPAGLYLVRIYRPGHLMRQKWVRIQAHQSRDLDAPLNRDESPEPELLDQLRGEMAQPQPGEIVEKLSLELAVQKLVLVNAGPGCTEKKCPVRLFWAEEKRWTKQKTVLWKGDGSTAIASLFPSKKPPKKKVDTTLASDKDRNPVLSLASATRVCITNSQCAFDERCDSGRCVYQTPVYRRWWFWTVIGVAVAGAAVGIAVPLSMPKNPVIEVK